VFERGTYTYRAAQLLLVLISLWGFGFGFTAWFCCFPSPSALWKMTGKGCYGACSSNVPLVEQLITTHGSLNFSFDVLVLGLAFRLLFVTEVQTTRTSMMVLIFVGSMQVSSRLFLLKEESCVGLTGF